MVAIPQQSEHPSNHRANKHNVFFFNTFICCFVSNHTHFLSNVLLKLYFSSFYILLSTFRHFEVSTYFCKSLYLFLSLFPSALLWSDIEEVVLGKGLCFLDLFLTDTLSPIQTEKNTLQHFWKKWKKWTEVKSLSETDQHWLNAGNSSRFVPVKLVFGTAYYHTTFYSMLYVCSAQYVNSLHAWNMFELLPLSKCSAQKKVQQCTWLHVAVLVCQMNHMSF